MMNFKTFIAFVLFSLIGGSNVYAIGFPRIRIRIRSRSYPEHLNVPPYQRRVNLADLNRISEEEATKEKLHKEKRLDLSDLAPDSVRKSYTRKTKIPNIKPEPDGFIKDYEHEINTLNTFIGTRTKVAQTDYLSDNSELNFGGSSYHANVGLIYRQLVICYIPIWNYGKPHYVLFSKVDDGKYNCITAELNDDDRKYLEENDVYLSASPGLPFWDELGGKLVAGAVVVFLIFLYSNIETA